MGTGAEIDHRNFLRHTEDNLSIFKILHYLKSQRLPLVTLTSKSLFCVFTF